MDNIIAKEQISVYVKRLKMLKISDIGNSNWLEQHDILVKLSQQAVLEAVQHHEEQVKEELLLHDMLEVLINDAYCVQLWKESIYPILLDINPNPPSTFLLYAVFFHEGAAVSLLDTILFDANAWTELDDTAVDLVDYCVAHLVKFIVIQLFEKPADAEETKDLDGSILSEMERQQKEIQFKIGMRCISILNYLAMNNERVSPTALRHIISKHDVPSLMMDILDIKPWTRFHKNGKFSKFIDEKWVITEGSELLRISKYEAQAWIFLHQLLLKPQLISLNQVTIWRNKYINKCMTMLNETILDQLPILIELKQFLCHFSTQGYFNSTPTGIFICEVLPQLKEFLKDALESAGGAHAVANQQKHIFLDNSKENIVSIAQRLSQIYNTDMLAEYENNLIQKFRNDIGVEQETSSNNKNVIKCNVCKQPAHKKCANCSIQYCSRNCQKDDWKIHKLNCKTQNE